MFSDHNDIKLEFNKNRLLIKPTNIQKIKIYNFKITNGSENYKGK